MQNFLWIKPHQISEFVTGNLSLLNHCVQLRFAYSEAFRRFFDSDQRSHNLHLAENKKNRPMRRFEIVIVFFNANARANRGLTRLLKLASMELAASHTPTFGNTNCVDAR
jgi:hypothetical protein